MLGGISSKIGAVGGTGIYLRCFFKFFMLWYCFDSNFLILNESNLGINCVELNYGQQSVFVLVRVRLVLSLGS